MAVLEAVRKTVKEHAKQPFQVGYRLSPEEAENPGITMDDTLQFADVLATKELDYLHVSVQSFWAGSIRNPQDKKSRVKLVQERGGHRVPVIGVGSLHTPDDALQALQTGVSLVALGREIIMEPDWVEKVKSAKENQIRVTLSRDDQAELVIPDPSWQAIVNSPGWFPLVERQAK
ncbi:hypothetical protein skT53_04520 [Effusibacillus dendaii]|uniref:NADH:flavin oxidoreductase/NADH oxidase N-terminal domain-containing protein n=1 Tax=Effusibacillus dendaii TaxID=2743772 RepID=A0A7I8D649_9BACL|nr:hypothetical protein skT53_04520 [Effusibacillus dendaii]